MRIVFFIRSFILLIATIGFFACQPKAPATDKEPVQLKIDFAEALMIYQAKYIWDKMDKKQQVDLADKLAMHYSNQQNNNSTTPTLSQLDTCYCYDSNNTPRGIANCKECEDNPRTTYIDLIEITSGSKKCFASDCAIQVYVNLDIHIPAEEDCGNSGDCLERRFNNFNGTIDLEDPIGPSPYPPNMTNVSVLFGNVPDGVNIKAVRFVENWTTTKSDNTYVSGSLNKNSFDGKIAVDFEIDNVLFNDMSFSINR